MMKRMLQMVMMGLLTLGVTAYAGDGVADAYLSMESTSVEDGAKDVSVDAEIFMKFSNNVVNLKVSENNLTCFTLYDGQGDEVAIEVIIGDDQVDRSIKNDITVKPVELLKEGEAYRLVVSERLMSKNGNNMLEDVVINFKTVGEAEDEGDDVLLYSGIALLFSSIAIILYSKKKKA